MAHQGPGPSDQLAQWEYESQTRATPMPGPMLRFKPNGTVHIQVSRANGCQENMIRQSHIRHLNAFAVEPLGSLFFGWDDEDDHLQPRIWGLPELQIVLAEAEDLHTTAIQTLLNLVKETSSEHYRNSSIGWNPKLKEEEMRERDMRYLIVYNKGDLDAEMGLFVRPLYPYSAMHSPSATDNKKRTYRGRPKPLAFLSFTICDDEPTSSVPIMWIYELHLRPEVRGKGLGAHLMFLAETIARKAELAKMSLQVFSVNSGARLFYGAQGFEKDEQCLPDREIRGRVVEPEYLALTKRLPAVQSIWK